MLVDDVVDALLEDGAVLMDDEPLEEGSVLVHVDDVIGEVTDDPLEIDTELADDSVRCSCLPTFRSSKQGSITTRTLLVGDLLASVFDLLRSAGAGIGGVLTGDNPWPPLWRRGAKRTVSVVQCCLDVSFTRQAAAGPELSLVVRLLVVLAFLLLVTRFLASASQAGEQSSSEANTESLCSFESRRPDRLRLMGEFDDVMCVTSLSGNCRYRPTCT